MEDDKELSKLKQPRFSSDEKAPLTLDFSGEAILARPLFRRSIDRQLIHELNGDVSNLAEKIRVELASRFPSVDISVNLEFSHGSIDFAGIIAIADWMSRVSGSASFIEYAIRAAQFAVNRIIRNRIEEQVPVRRISTKVTWRKEEPFHLITRGLWWCSGTVPDLIRSSRTDKAKYEGIGGAILTTGVLAFLSGFYAIYTMFQGTDYASVLAGLMGVVWGLVIFNLDRYIVSSMRKESENHGNRAARFMKELPPAIPRLLLAAIIGVTLSKPLELRLFQKPINEQVAVIHDDQVKLRQASLAAIDTDQRSKLDGELSQINSAVAERYQRVNALQDEFHKESDSTGGSQRYGYSTVAKIKEGSYLTAKKDAEQFEHSQNGRKAELQKLKDNIDVLAKDRLEEFRRTLGSDFLTKMRALSDLTKQHDSVWWANWFVIFLLILIEITPVIVKLMSPSGPYDVKLNMTNDAESQEAQFRHDALIAIAQHHYARITEAENQADDMLFDLRRHYGDEKLRLSFEQWNRQFDLSGHGPTFEEFLRFVRDNVFSHRRP